jgi:hypothetical protein
MSLFFPFKSRFSGPATVALGLSFILVVRRFRTKTIRRGEN